MENWDNRKNRIEAYIQNQIKAYLLFTEISASELSSSEKRDQILEAIKQGTKEERLQKYLKKTCGLLQLIGMQSKKLAILLFRLNTKCVLMA